MEGRALCRADAGNRLRFETDGVAGEAKKK